MVYTASASLFSACWDHNNPPPPTLLQLCLHHAIKHTCLATPFYYVWLHTSLQYSAVVLLLHMQPPPPPRALEVLACQSAPLSWKHMYRHHNVLHS
jgi:hypothetical protein